MLRDMQRSHLGRTQLTACDVGSAEVQTTDGAEFSAVHLHLKRAHVGWRSSNPNYLHWGGLRLPQRDAHNMVPTQRC